MGNARVVEHGASYSDEFDRRNNRALAAKNPAGTPKSSIPQRFKFVVTSARPFPFG